MGEEGRGFVRRFRHKKEVKDRQKILPLVWQTVGCIRERKKGRLLMGAQLSKRMEQKKD